MYVSSSAAALVVSSIAASPGGACSGALVVNADGVDATAIDMNRARVAMTTAVPPLQAFYGQSS